MVSLGSGLVCPRGCSVNELESVLTQALVNSAALATNAIIFVVFVNRFMEFFRRFSAKITLIVAGFVIEESQLVELKVRLTLKSKVSDRTYRVIHALF